jgi:GSH-dependent disulfide-bond oxidoreductase
MIELHTTATANGYKASIMLEECGLPYCIHEYDLVKGEHRSAGYLALNPVGRLPSIVDPDAGAGAPVVVYGTQAILLYLAEKTGLYLPASPAARAAVYTWLGFVSSDLAPAYSGQFVFGVLMQEKSPSVIEYYERLVDRMLTALEAQLARTTWLAGDSYTIADIIAYPVAATSARRYPGNLAGYPQLTRWAAMVAARPAVQRGMRVPR